MCYQFIYYPSPNLFIKQLVIDKNHIVRYNGAGLVTLLTWGPTQGSTHLGWTRIRACGPIICKNRQYDIHITAQIYFLHIGSHQKAKIFSYVVVQCKSKMAASVLARVASGLGSANTHVTYLLQALLSYTFYKQFRIYCKHCINYFVLAFPILL